MERAKRPEHRERSAAHVGRGSGLDALLTGVVLLTATGFRYLAERQIQDMVVLSMADLLVTFEVVLIPLALALMIVAARGQRPMDIGTRSGFTPLALALVLTAAVGAAAVLVVLSHEAPGHSAAVLTPPLAELPTLTAGLVGALLVWAEELLRRGFLLNEIAAYLGGSRWAWAGSLWAMAVTEMAGHAPAGPTAALTAGLTDLVLSAAYLAAGRSLWSPMLARGLAAGALLMGATAPANG